MFIVLTAEHMHIYYISPYNRYILDCKEVYKLTLFSKTTHSLGQCETVTPCTVLTVAHIEGLHDQNRI